MGSINRDLIEYHGINNCSYKDIKNFKQVSNDYMLCLPDAKPNMEHLVKVWVDSIVIDKEIIKTPKGTSFEGQNLTGYKLLVCGDIHLKVEYVACDKTQSIHTAHSTFPICEYVVLPKDFNFNSLISASIIIEDVFSEQVDSRCLYNNITMLVVADVC